MYDWIGRHARLVVTAVVVGALALGAIGSMVADEGEPSFDPEGAVFDVADRAGELLRSRSRLDTSVFLVEASDGGDVLTADVLDEWLVAADRVRSADAAGHLGTTFDADLGVEVAGLTSIAEAVDAQLSGGLGISSDDQVKGALAEILEPGADTAGLRFTLSEDAQVIDGVWTASAFTARVVYDKSTFPSYLATERWLREVQSTVQEGAVHTDTIGIAIDGDLTFEEAAEASSPYIFLAVALIILLIAIVHRSFWSSVVVAAGLGLTMLTYYGVASLVGLQMGSLLLAFVVPIATVSFGVDFFIHGSGRVRESEIDSGTARAYPRGMSAVFGAMLLAAMSSVAAFLSNAVSGTEAIVEFGIGSAIAIGSAYLILGQIAPRALLAVQRYVGPSATLRWSRPLYWLGQMAVAVVGGLSVALAAVVPTVGTAATAATVVVVGIVPALLARRRNRRAAARGREMTMGHRGAAHGIRAVGSVVSGLAARPGITLSVLGVIIAVALSGALNVRSAFDIDDFLSSDTDFSQSIERANRLFPSSGEGSSFILVEGDLTDPLSLAALDVAVDEIDVSSADFGRRSGGDLIVGLHAADIVRMTMESPEALASMSAQGVIFGDANGDGIPDRSAAVRAIYDYVTEHGVPAPGGGVAVSPQELSGLLFDDGATAQATRIVVQVGSFTDGAIIEPVWDQLEASAGTIEALSPGLSTGVSGDVITEYVSLESFTDSMLVALPLAVVLTLLIAALMLRSLRYALAAVLPIGFVVVGLYAFMYVAGYTVNVVTATIAAIAVGVGIDFSTHFTARYREELETGGRLAALRRAGEGTGGALVLSAMTSILGFAVMAMAPTPIFSTFGVLTAVMIALALTASVVVLPSILMVVTPASRASRSHESAPVAVDPEPARATA